MRLLVPVSLVRKGTRGLGEVWRSVEVLVESEQVAFDQGGRPVTGMDVYENPEIWTASRARERGCARARANVAFSCWRDGLLSEERACKPACQSAATRC